LRMQELWGKWNMAKVMTNTKTKPIPIDELNDDMDRISIRIPRIHKEEIELAAKESGRDDLSKELRWMIEKWYEGRMAIKNDKHE
jgi:hypothetical protein